VAGVPSHAADIVRAIFGAFAARDQEAALALCHDDFEFWPQGTAERAGRTEPYRGPTGMREYLADVERVWDELVVEPGDLRVAGGGVVAFGLARGRPANGADEVAIPVIWVFKIDGGRVRSIRVVATAADADAALA
jgi:ketosteroid isomerase-like protein